MFYNRHIGTRGTIWKIRKIKITRDKGDEAMNRKRNVFKSMLALLICITMCIPQGVAFASEVSEEVINIEKIGRAHV